MKAVFSERQQKVSFNLVGGFYYVYVCLNEEIKEQETTNKNDDMTDKEKVYEYDYNEFRVDASKLDIESVVDNPEQYLDYPQKQKTQEEVIEEQQKQIDVLTQCILEMSEIVYGE